MNVGRLVGNPCKYQTFIGRSSAKAFLVLLSEFSGHSDLHVAEGIALQDEKEIDQDMETTILAREEHPHEGAESKLSVMALDAKDPLPRPMRTSTAVSRSNTGSHRHAYGFKDWASVLLGSTAAKPRAKTAESRQKHARRLGVSIIGLHCAGAD